MTVIDAFWELRNLGVTTQEVEVESTDTLEDVESVLNTLDADYQVIKTPVANMKMNYLLSSQGFSFAEAMMKVSHDLKDLSCPKLIKRLSDQLSYDEMNEKEFQIMQDEINKGMFQSDRIILDPYFTPVQAANRYILWMNDERQRGTKLISYKYKGQPIGFNCLKETRQNVFYPVLGGIYNGGKTIPLGSVVVYKQLEIIKELGGKELFTFISSNNPSVVSTYSQFGYIFKDFKYVFVKHKS